MYSSLKDNYYSCVIITWKGDGHVHVYSLLDYSTGFGGKYGVQKDRVDQVMILRLFKLNYYVLIIRTLYKFMLKFLRQLLGLNMKAKLKSMNHKKVRTPYE